MAAVVSDGNDGERGVFAVHRFVELWGALICGGVDTFRLTVGQILTGPPYREPIELQGVFRVKTSMFYFGYAQAKETNPVFFIVTQTQHSRRVERSRFA